MSFIIHMFYSFDRCTTFFSESRPKTWLFSINATCYHSFGRHLKLSFSLSFPISISLALSRDSDYLINIVSPFCIHSCICIHIVFWRAALVIWLTREKTGLRISRSTLITQIKFKKKTRSFVWEIRISCEFCTVGFF